MQANTLTTPFGRRTLTLGMIKAQARTQEALRDASRLGSNAPAAVNKWTVFRRLTEARESLGVSDRSLGVLNALLSFHPETALTLPNPASEALDPTLPEASGGEGEGACSDLVVFPSNRQLSLRAHGMAEKTLRNHLAALVAAGLIIRRDSPNGKRYARKDPSGQDRFSDAFGFDLTPLVARAGEFEALAEQAKRELRELRLMRERVSLHRRDLAKMIALGLEEGLAGPWESYRAEFLTLLTPLRKLGALAEAEPVAQKLGALRQQVEKLLESFAMSPDSTGNDGCSSQHISNSTNINITNSERAIEDNLTDEDRAESGAEIDKSEASVKQLPLALVLEACPDIVEYGPEGRIRNWGAFCEAARLVRPMIGISQDAWSEALHVLGLTNASVAIAAILQRSVHSSEAETSAGTSDGSAGIRVNSSPAIRSAGGYLRALTEKARAGEFALGPVLMALIGQRLKRRRGMANPWAVPSGSAFSAY